MKAQSGVSKVLVKIWFMIDYEGAMGFGHKANALELPDGFHLFSKNGAGAHGNKLWGQSYSPQVGTDETFSLFKNKVEFVLEGSLKYDAVFVVTVSSSPEDLDVLINSLTNQVLSDYKIDADACPHTSVYTSEWLHGDMPGSGVFSHALRIPSIYYNILWSNLSEDGFKITPIYNLEKVRKKWKLIKEQRSIN